MPRMHPTTLQIIGAVLFGIALIHTFSTKFFEHLAHTRPAHAGLWHFLAEVEVVFGFWAMVLMVFMFAVNGKAEAVQYIDSRNFTEPLFVFAIMVTAASKPIIQLAGLLTRILMRLIPLPTEATFEADAGLLDIDGMIAFSSTLRKYDSATFRFVHRPSPGFKTVRLVSQGDLRFTPTDAPNGTTVRTPWDIELLAAQIYPTTGTRAAVYAQGEVDHVFTPLGATQITAIDLLAHAGEAAAEGGRLTAPMPGKVVSFAVKAGDAVTKGQPLAVMEAMKMEHTIAAPADGTVAELLYAPGDQVAEGAELLKIQTA